MRADDWHLTDDVEKFLARAGEFLHARPALHTVPLTVTEKLRTRGAHVYGAGSPVFGTLEGAEGVGGVRAAFFRTPPRRLNLTPLAPAGCGTLAARLAAIGHLVPGVGADRDTAAAFAAAWQRHTGATPTLHARQRLYRLGELAPPQPSPEGRSRIAAERDREQLVQWHREFTAAVGNADAAESGAWADSRIADGRITFWETPEGTPVSMAGVTAMVAGQVRVTPVFTPAHLRGRGYAGAVTAAVGAAARAAGADEVLLFADLANPTSNGLYRRIGYRAVKDFAVYDFQDAAGGRGGRPGPPS